MAHNQCQSYVSLRHDTVHVHPDFVNGLLHAELWKSEEQFHEQVVLKRDGEAFTTVAITRVVFHQGGLLSGWSFIRVVRWSSVRVVRWSSVRVVFHQASLVSVWSFIRVL